MIYKDYTTQLGKNMTICIAAIACNRKGIVVATDRMVTASGLALEYEHDSKKMDVISNNCLAMTAGDALIGWEIINNLQQKDDSRFDYIAGKVGEKYVIVRDQKLNESYFQPVGLTLDNFLKEGKNILPEAMFSQMMQTAGNFALDIVILLAGVDKRGAHISTVTAPQKSGNLITPFDRIGYHAIGSGGVHATVALALCGHSVNAPIEKALYNIYKAKRAAEVAPGVGESTNMAIIDEKGIKVVSDEIIATLSSILDEEKGHVSELNEVKGAINGMEKGQ